VFWSFDPFRLHRPQLLGAELSIFHSVDKYDFRPAGEAQLARSVDHVFCSSESFVGTYRPLNESVHVLPHGISGDEFEAESGHPAELPDSYGLYVGNIDERVDFRLVETALAALPETTFVFVGRIGYAAHNEAARRLFEERRYRNLVATGPIHFKRLRNYIARASFCLAFMNKRVNGNLVGHHKMLQYLALGKPVFGCTLSDYRAVAGLLYMDDDDQALIGRLVGYVRHGEPPGLAAERIAYARRFQFEELLERVDRILFPGASRES
jgi:hypothetical protein